MTEATTPESFEFRLSEIAEQFEIELTGDAELPIRGLCGLSDNRPDNLSFIADDKYVAQARASAIPAFVVRPGTHIEGKSMLVHEDPNYAIALIAGLFTPSSLGRDQGTHASAVISESAQIADSASIGPNVVVGDHVVIGGHTRVLANAVIMDRAVIGDGCLIYPQCVIREDCVLGDRVTLQPGAVIGGDGFGYATHAGKHTKIPQIGNVMIEDDVEVGANATIDRGRFSATVVGRGTKIDNLVMIAHNVQIGEHCLVCAQTGISGSSTLGNHVTCAGQVGIIGHIDIGDGVTLYAQSMVTRNIGEPGVYGGSPARPGRVWHKAMARLYAGLGK